jgi:hypothetical protein
MQTGVYRVYSIVVDRSSVRRVAAVVNTINRMVPLRRRETYSID